MTDEREGYWQALGQGIAQRRDRLGMSAAELGRRMRDRQLQWTRNTVTAVEHGRRELSLLEAAAVCSELGASLDKLVEPNGEPLAYAPGAAVSPAQVLRTLGRGAVLEFVNLGTAQSGVGDRETNEAARKLGRRAEEVLAASNALWGMPLRQQRDLLYQTLASVNEPPDKQAAMRGHFSRHLMRQLKNYFDKQEES
jgi:transcriptional regulator with XRE-family HTH domain